MKKLVLLLLLGSCLISAGAVQWSENKSKEKPVNKTSKIQLALLLDTSNSMDGLIEQAKAKLWAIVNELSESQIHGQVLDIEIALYDYGNKNYSSRDYFVRQQIPFTNNIDDISEKLFALTTNGGQEYCGAVLQKSIAELAWQDDAAYKVIFIAGNESFAQGPIPFRSVIADAQEQDIVVNTIFCGELNEGINLQWKDAAILGRGDFFVINQNEAITYIKTPQDEKIAVLNRKLNQTYIPYGKDGEERYEKLKNQDKNASSYGSSNMASRTIYKTRKQYNNANWDLIDAYDQSKDIIHSTDKLPEEYKQLSPTERELKIINLKQTRGQIKEEIKQLSYERKEVINNENKKNTSNSLEESMIKSLQQQMNTRGIQKELRKQ